MNCWRKPLVWEKPRPINLIDFRVLPAVTDEAKTEPFLDFIYAPKDDTRPLGRQAATVISLGSRFTARQTRD